MKITTSVIIVGLFYVLLVWIYGGWVRDDRHASFKAPERPVETRSAEDRLIDALIAVESNGDDSAIGDFGHAIGCLQIHPIMVRDVNRILGWDKYSLDDRYDRAKSINMCKTYLNHYCRDMKNESKAACWVAGPDGYKQINEPKVKNYVKKVIDKEVK